MDARDVSAELRTLSLLSIGAGMTEEDAGKAMRILAGFNQCMVGLVRFEGETPWERHPEDELLYLLEGEVDVTLLPASGPAQHATLRTGSVFVVPRGLWHRQLARKPAALLFVTSSEGNDASTAVDPRT
ncbi:MAG: cupin domain-containing protein [Candidatus Rokuibacteriota bacterium]